MAAAAPSHVPGWFTPDVGLLQVAVTALDPACSAGASPLEYEGRRQRQLPDVHAQAHAALRPGHRGHVGGALAGRDHAV